MTLSSVGQLLFDPAQLGFIGHLRPGEMLPGVGEPVDHQDDAKQDDLPVADADLEAFTYFQSLPIRKPDLITAAWPVVDLGRNPFTVEIDFHLIPATQLKTIRELPMIGLVEN